jgi:hypothetical protein
VHWMPKFGHFQIAHKIWGRLNVWNGRYVDLAGKRGLFALLDRSRYDSESEEEPPPRLIPSSSESDTEDLLGGDEF